MSQRQLPSGHVLGGFRREKAGQTIANALYSRTRARPPVHYPFVMTLAFVLAKSHDAHTELRKVERFQSS